MTRLNQTGLKSIVLIIEKYVCSDGLNQTGLKSIVLIMEKYVCSDGLNQTGLTRGRHQKKRLFLGLFPKLGGQETWFSYDRTSKMAFLT